MDRQYFRLTEKSGDNYPGLYRYDIWSDSWTRLTLAFLGEGTSFPSAGMINGDTFFRTDAKKLYTYDGTSWTVPTTSSHDALTDVGSSDHHSVFTSSQHASVEHLASMLNQAIQPYNSNITFTRKSGSEHNAITYTAGEIKFQDGTARSITPAGELTGLSVGDNYIYFKLDSASLFSTTSHSEAISSGRGLLAIIIVASASDPDVPCAVQPFYAKGLNVTADTMAVTLLSAISAYLGNVSVADGRILLGDTGIIGRDAEETVRFYISNDGRAYFAGGLVALDEDGMNVNDGDVVIDSSGIKALGETLRFYDANEVLRGSIFGVTTGCLSIYTPGWLLINPSSDGVKLNTGPFFPGADGVQAIGKSGASPARFRYFTPRSTLANRPAPSIDTVGLVWCTREEAGTLERYWICLINALNNYFWLELGLGGGGGGGDMLKATYDPDEDGVIATAQIGVLPASKITSEQFTLSRMPRSTDGYVLTATGGGSDPIYETIRFPLYTSKPAPGPTYSRKPIVVRSGSDAKSYIYVCVLNDNNDYEWIQIGVST